jgi:uncharacterized protein with HEPN domain
MTKDNSIYLNHILDSINSILSFTEDLDLEGFLNNKLVKDATIRNLEIIGEAAKNLTPDYRKKHPDVDWKGMAGMRDKLIHHYMGVDIPSVWGVIVEVLPDLNQKISILLEEF